MKYLKITQTDGTRFILRITNETPRFISGIEVDTDGEEIVPRSTDARGRTYHQRQRVVERGAIKKTVPMRMNLTYATLEDATRAGARKKVGGAMVKTAAQLNAEIAEALGKDRSTHGTVIEYAVQELFKRKTPKKAAEVTTNKLAGAPNMFLGVHPPDVVQISAKKLEDALWERLVDAVLKGVASFKPDKAHWALDATITQFRQRPTLRAELKRRVIARLGRDPFKGLE